MPPREGTVTPGLGEPGAVPALRAGGQGSVPPPRRHLAGLAAAGWHRREGRAAPAVVSPPVRPPGAGGGVGGFAGSGPAGRVTVPTAAGWTRPPWDMPPHLVLLAGCWHCRSSLGPTGVGGGHVLLVAPACHCPPRHPPPHTTRVDGSPQRHPRERPRLCPLVMMPWSPPPSPEHGGRGDPSGGGETSPLPGEQPHGGATSIAQPATSAQGHGQSGAGPQSPRIRPSGSAATRVQVGVGDTGTPVWGGSVVTAG